MSRYSNKNYYTKKKTKKTSNRENFLQLYNRTCHRIYYYSYDLCGNVSDADMIFRDAFIYMHQHIGELRSSKSIDSWQKECVEISFRALLRSQLLNLIKDPSPVYSASSTLPENRKEELWNRIIKMSDIDPWRMVPIPGKSTVFSVLADQTISDLRYMSFVDILKSAALVIALGAAAVAAVVFVVDYIADKAAGKVDETQEIFLDERYYSDYVENTVESLDPEQLASAYQSALKYDIDEEGNRKVYTAPASIGNTAGTPTYTEDVDVNARLIEIVESVITEDMSDPEKLRALYIYVGGFMEYRDYPAGKDNVAILKESFDRQAGTSQHYSVLLSALCNAAGYRCEVIKGTFIMNRGTEFESPMEHYWNRVYLNGIVYYMDIEADCDETGTTVREYYFMAADGTAKWEIFERDHKWN